MSEEAVLKTRDQLFEVAQKMLDVLDEVQNKDQRHATLTIVRELIDTPGKTA